MRRLTRPANPRRNERGATAVIVALVITFIAVPAMALSVDIGSIMSERRQLQNGTDASSMALAKLCAASTSNCDASAAASSLNALASQNAGDSMAQLNVNKDLKGQCARPPQGVTYDSSKMPMCASASTALTAAQKDSAVKDLGSCPPLSDYFMSGAGAGLGYVETNIQTKSSASGDNTLLPSIFASAITGGGTHQTACARAAWGPGAPNSLNVLALTMSECDWASQVGYTGPGTAHYPDGPAPATPAYPYGYGDAAHPWPTIANPAIEMRVWSKGNPTPNCDTSSPGGLAPGGFGWLSGVSGGCQTIVNDGRWVPSDPGADGCPSSYLDPYVGHVVFIPVFDCRSSGPRTGPVPTTTPPFDCLGGSGSGVVYHISGFAGFYLTGYKLNGSDKRASIATGRTDCGGSGGEGGQQCLFGWFLKDIIPAGDFVISTTTDPNYGITIVKPAG